MRNLIQKNGTWHVRLQVPADLREAWGKSAEIRSLKTKDQYRAASLAAPIQERFKAQVAALRAQTAVAPTFSSPAIKPLTRALWTPEEAEAAIRRWADAVLAQAYLEHFHGIAPAHSPLGDEAVAAADLTYKLSQRQWSAIPDFDARLIEVLERDGLKINATSPALRYLRPVFGAAWEQVERRIERFRHGDFSRWDAKAATVEPAATEAAPIQPPAPSGKLTLTDLVERYLTGSAKPPAKTQVDDIRAVVRRLAEFHGDISPAQITPVMADDFGRAIADFPVTRRRDILEKPIRVILAEHAPKIPTKLSANSRRKWIANLSRVFGYAVTICEAKVDPFTNLRPAKPKRHELVKARRHYEPEEIKLLFSRPLFTGFSGKAGVGYRNEPGHQIVKDERFWLPIFALWHGCRLEEIAAARVDELRLSGTTHYFDWTTTNRPFKTEESRRVLPIHPKLIELGWLEYVEGLGDSPFLFPNLAGDEGEKMSKLYSKWFGRWSDEIGLKDRSLDFHAFRHTFKNACRGVMDEELHDLLTGHTGSGGVGRRYGPGAGLERLAEALAKVDYPTFPVGRSRA